MWKSKSNPIIPVLTLDPAIMAQLLVPTMLRDTPLDTQDASIVDKIYETIHDVSRYSKTEATNLESENLAAEPKLQPAVHLINFSNISQAPWIQPITTAPLNMPVLPIPTIEENNRLYNPNPNNEPTKAWVLHGFNRTLARQAQNNIDMNESVIGLKSLGY